MLIVRTEQFRNKKREFCDTSKEYCQMIRRLESRISFLELREMEGFSVLKSRGEIVKIGDITGSEFVLKVLDPATHYMTPKNRSEKNYLNIYATLSVEGGVVKMLDVDVFE